MRAVSRFSVSFSYFRWRSLSYRWRCLVLGSSAILATQCSEPPTQSPVVAHPMPRTEANSECDVVDVQPDEVITIYRGLQQRYRAYRWNCYEMVWVNTQVDWSSDNTAVATVTPGGNFLEGWWADATGVGAGTTLIRGTFGAASDASTLTVLVPYAVNISGPANIMRYQSAQYTANVSGGNSPYSYQWRTREGWVENFGPWSSWYSTGSQNFTYMSVNACGINRKEIAVRVTDASWSTTESFMRVNITNPC
jgi:hypothetical protein